MIYEIGAAPYEIPYKFPRITFFTHHFIRLYHSKNLRILQKSNLKRCTKVDPMYTFLLKILKGPLSYTFLLKILKGPLSYTFLFEI